ncbi:hypothetical protein EVAR_76397_1 [Eumeta japonica]|uniref:Uncharacterized protein n=1 Tax=Eumeta variegata TaxID=151549 RepID=A0A4C1TB73_EUMVA|nr:hypothetical protein EVAR_76397_1 [Eumeta japonica]
MVACDFHVHPVGPSHATQVVHGGHIRIIELCLGFLSAMEYESNCSAGGALASDARGDGFDSRPGTVPRSEIRAGLLNPDLLSSRPGSELKARLTAIRVKKPIISIGIANEVKVGIGSEAGVEIEDRTEIVRLSPNAESYAILHLDHKGWHNNYKCQQNRKTVENLSAVGRGDPSAAGLAGAEGPHNKHERHQAKPNCK